MPYLTRQPRGDHAVSLGAALARLDRAARRRLGASAPRSERASYAWSQAYSTLGESALGTTDAVRALHAAVSSGTDARRRVDQPERRAASEAAIWFRARQRASAP